MIGGGLFTAATHLSADKSDITTKTTENENGKSYNPKIEGDPRTFHSILSNYSGVSSWGHGNDKETI